MPVTIRDYASPPPTWVSSTFDADVVILPKRLDGNDAIYSDRLASIVKALRADGVDARWSHDADHRLWDGERSAFTDLVLQFVVGVGSAAGWAGLARLLGKRSGTVKLKVGYRKGPSDGEERWLELEGSSADLAATLDRLNPWQLPEPPSGQQAQDE